LKDLEIGKKISDLSPFNSFSNLDYRHFPCFFPIGGGLAPTFFLATIPLASGSFLLKGIQLVLARGCQHHFGYLNQRDRIKSIPKECIECKKAVECMLNQPQYSADAVKEIEKWY
jgi:hypothetical protein